MKRAQSANGTLVVVVSPGSGEGAVSYRRLKTRGALVDERGGLGVAASDELGLLRVVIKLGVARLDIGVLDESIGVGKVERDDRSLGGKGRDNAESDAKLEHLSDRVVERVNREQQFCQKSPPWAIT